MLSELNKMPLVLIGMEISLYSTAFIFTGTRSTEIDSLFFLLQDIEQTNRHNGNKKKSHFVRLLKVNVAFKQTQQPKNNFH